MSADWFCKIGDKTVGPLNGQQLKVVVARGKLLPEHLIRRGTEGPWVPAGRVKGLFPDAASGGAGKKSPPKSAGKPQSPPKAAALPTAQAAPTPPAADLPEELSVGSFGHHKKHVAMNVDKLDIQTQPIKVTRRRSHGVPGLKKAEQQKLMTILGCVIGGGLLIGITIFVIAGLSGKLSSGPSEAVKKAEPKAEEVVDKKAEEKKAAEKKEKEENNSWKKVSLDSASVGDVDLKVLKPLREATPDGTQVDKQYEEVMIFPVSMRLKEGAKESVEFTSWADDSLKKDVVLKDDSGVKYPLLDIVNVKGDGKTIAAGKGLLVRMLFPPLSKRVKFLHLEFPATALGGKGMSRWEAAGLSVRDLAEKKESADDADAKPKATKKAKAGDDDAADADAKPVAKKKSVKKQADEDEK